MNPYIQQALDPQLEYMRRQAAINQQGDMAKLAQAGAFGGSRQAILQGQNQEALMRQQATTAGTGYEKAYNAAMAQYNADQQREMEAQKASEQSKQYGAGYRQTALSNAANSEQARAQAGASEAQYGLANLNALSAAGAQQQALEQEALDAQYKDWLRQTEYPSKQLEQMKGLITGLSPVMPKTETQYGKKDKAAATVAGAIGMGKEILDSLGIKSFADLKAKALAAGQSIKDFAKSIGVKEEDLPQEVGQEGQGVIPGERAKTGLEEPPILEDGTVPEITIPDYTPDFGGYDPEEFSIAAEGGLVGMLHKMRGYK